MDNLYDDIAPTEDIGRPAAEGCTSREPVVPDCSAWPSRAEIDAERSSESVTVDKRHYNYLCKFKKNDIQRIRKACQVDISPAPGSDCNNIEVQFVKAQKGTCSKWRRRFIELYELWEDKLVIERINLAEIENENKLLGKINGISEHFSGQDNNTLEIICEKKSIDQIRKIVDKCKVKAAKEPVNLPVGYEVGGAFCLYLYVADIRDLKVEAVVNVSSDCFQADFELDAELTEAARAELVKYLKEAPRNPDKIKPHGFSATAGNLPCRTLIHAIGPRWPKRGDEGELNTYRKQLTESYEKIITATAEAGCGSVALSLIDSESYGVPDQAVAKALNDAITKTSLKCRKSNLKEVHVVNGTESILHQFVSELLEDSRPKLFRRVSVTRLSDEEVQKVIEDKVIAKEHRSDGKPLVESLDNLYTAVEKPVRQISSEKPPVPDRKNKPNIAMPKKKYTAPYENVAPPVPQKNPELLRQLQDIGQTGNGSNPPTVDEKVTPSAARNDQDAGLGTKGKQVTPEGVHRGLGKVGREKEGNNAGITTVPPEGLLGEEKKTPSPIKDDKPPLYDLAGPLPSMNTGTRPNLKLDQGKGTENYAYEEVTPIQAYVTKKAPETPEDKVIVDKRHYNYLCKFKKNDIQRIRKACQVDISPAPGSDCNNIEVQFVKAQKDTCSKWRRRFIELYELWEDKLVIERINLAEIENENKLLGKINGISEHFSGQDNNTLEIICEKKSIDQIRKIVDKFKVKAAKQKVNLTVDSGNAEIQPS